MTRLILASAPIWGHVSPMLTIGRELAGRGHEVTVLTGSAFEERVRAAGIGFADVDALAGTAPVQIDPGARARLAVDGPDRFAWDLEYWFVAAVPAQHRALQRLVEADPDTVILFETGFFGASPMLLGAPGPRARAAIGIGTTSLTVSSVDLGPFGAGMPRDDSPAGRQRNAAANAGFQKGLLGRAQSAFQAALRGLGVDREAPFFLDAPVLLPDRFLQLSIEELSYVRSDLPPGLRFVGALPAPRYDSPLPEWWSGPWTEKPVIVVTQGTVGNTDLGELIEPALAGLAEEDVSVIATTGSDAERPDAPANAHVETLIPFGELLPHAAVLVSNGGFGAVQQALSSGIPLVVAGLAEEKLESNTRLAATGAAIDLRTQRPDPQQIRDAVRRILTEPEFRAAAERLADEYRGLDPIGAIDASIRDLAGR